MGPQELNQSGAHIVVLQKGRVYCTIPIIACNNSKPSACTSRVIVSRATLSRMHPLCSRVDIAPNMPYMPCIEFAQEDLHFAIPDRCTLYVFLSLSKA